VIDELDDIPVQLADQIAVSLNAQFAGEFSAVRSFIPEHELQQLAALKVSIIPGGLEASELLDDDFTQDDNQVGVAFQKRVNRSSDEEAREVLRLVRRVRKWISRNRLIEIGDEQFAIIDMRQEPYVDAELLESGHLFSGLVLTIRHLEDLSEDDPA